MRTSRDERGQAEVLGVVLLLGVTVISVGAIVVAGNAALDATQSNVGATAVENALYQYDAAAAQVAYGNADQRRVTLGPVGQGRYEVRPDAGWINVTHRNYTDAGADEPILNQTLGALVYERGDTAIGAQGGAVFRRDGAGSVLLSAPQMVYRSQTFTVPVIAIRDGGNPTGDSGSVTALVRNGGTTRVVYPNKTKAYGDGDPYSNPISGGEVAVTVKSDYYVAWASYFRTISPDVNVTVTESRNRTTLVLPTDPISGESVSLTGGQSLRGINDSKHAVNEMNITLPGGQANWNSFGSATVEISGFRGTYSVTFQNTKGTDGPCSNDVEVDVIATYNPDVGNIHRWEKQDAFKKSTGAFTYGCPDGNYELYANLTGATNLSYESGPEPVTFDQHPSDDGSTYNHTEEASIDLLTNHYVALVGENTELSLSAGSAAGGGGPGGPPGGSGNGQNSINTDAATGAIDYDSSTVITYLRVTDTVVNTTLN